MPISRYEIRNEYSLADPDLYRSAEKDDPESLLEGVAMAGLVGVLRQLGDLAEFAADIFHNLHEEAMATAARSHGLVVRVQQLETEIPHIERAFLSQTDHSSFFNHTGFDWHPNLRIDQNLITKGDLPRLVMDSYEECRPPPRLFLLDKFDTAGAGACLKRYSDPSFFKVENSGMTNADVAPREKKIRKAKKKGPHWKIGETAEVLPTSHAKLHQLFMEEVRIENGGSNPSRNAKLKRKLNGFPFNTKNGKSYMDKFLEYTSPDNNVVHEVTVNSSSLPSATFEYNESGLQVVEVRPVSPHRENGWRERSPPSFIDKGEIIVNSSRDDKIREVPNFYPRIATDIGISSSHNEKIIDMDSCREGGLTGYQWDDNVSEADNYVDATSTVESDTDENSTSRVNNDFTHSHVKSDSLISDPNEENLQTMSFDSRSTGNSTISEEDNNSSGKGMSSFSSNSPSTSVENPQSERISTRVFSSEVVDDFPENDEHSEHIVSDVSFHKYDYEQATSDSRFVENGMLEGTKSNKTVSAMDDEEKRSARVRDPSCSPSLSRKSSVVPYISSHKADDSSGKVTSDLLHWGVSDREGQNSGETSAFKFNLFNVHSWDTIGNPSGVNSSETLPGQLDDEFQKLRANFPSEYTDIVHNGDNDMVSTVSKEDNIIRGLDNGDSGISNHSPNQFPSYIDTFLKKKREETSSADAETIDDGDNHSEGSIGIQISSKDVVLSHLEKNSNWPWTGHDAHERNVIPEEYMTVNEDVVPETLNEPAGTSKYAEMEGTRSNEPEVTEKSPDEFHILSMEDKPDTADMVSAVPPLSHHPSTGHEVIESSGSDDLISLNEVHIPLDETDKSTVADMAFLVPALSDSAIMDNIPSEIGLTKLVEEKVHSFEDSDIDEPESVNNSLSESRWKLSLEEKVDQTKAATSGFENNDHPQSEVLGNTVPISHDVEVVQGLELVHPKATKPPVEQSFLNGEDEIPQQGRIGNHVSDPPSLHVAEETIVQEDFGLHFRGINSDGTLILPIINDQQMPDLSETDLANTPPLPPLPPPQWMMMGKPEFGSSPFPQIIFHPTEDDDASYRSPLEEITHSPIQTASKEKPHLHLPSTEQQNELFPQIVSNQIVYTDEIKKSPIQIPDNPTSKEERGESYGVEAKDDPTSKEEKTESYGVEAKDDPTSKEEKTESYGVEVKDDPTSKEEKTESSRMHETVDLPPLSENKQQQSVMTTEEDGVANGSQVVKLQRLRHPLIDEFTALDKNKLRKVTERHRPPQEKKVDERNSILEQIRTKSFNLKPALATRPSYRGPNTNLKIAAIVEKANAIRQAFADSDEDDDSWSDS